MHDFTTQQRKASQMAIQLMHCRTVLMNSWDISQGHIPSRRLAGDAPVRSHQEGLSDDIAVSLY